MLKTRVIPCLLLREYGLYKTVKFKTPKYVGDPVNAVRIFNDKEVDEILLLDIDATPDKREPNFQLIGDIAGECFMPLTYGGGIRSIDQIKRLHRLGVEKISLNSAAFLDRRLVAESCDKFGSSSIVAAIDTRRTLLGRHEVWIDGGRSNTKEDPVRYAAELAKLGVGEILINSIDRDGTASGYDIELLKRIAASVDVPIIACGGAGSIEDMRRVVLEAGVSAVAAGSMFVFHGKHRAVLISYPSQEELTKFLP